MALIKCKECGKEFSNTATICPHCGYNTKKGHIGCIPSILIIVSVYVLINYIGLFIYENPIPSTKINNMGTQTSGNKESTKPIVENKTTDTEKQKLFSGYQDIKFGMSQEEVKKLFSGKLTHVEKNYLEIMKDALKYEHGKADYGYIHYKDFPGDFMRVGKDYMEYIKDNARISFWFADNQLYEIDVIPSFAGEGALPRDYCSNNIQMTRNSLSKKYGKYEEMSRMTKLYERAPVLIKYYIWSYKDKQVILLYLDQDCQTLEIRYRDIGIIREQEKRRNLQDAKKAKEYSQQKQKELERLL